MDLRVYYEKIREIESEIADEYPVIVSKATGDGGKEGTLTEVPRRLAAKMSVDGTARLASAEETKGFRDQQAEIRRSLEQAAAATRLQVSVLSTRELEQLKADARRPGKA